MLISVRSVNGALREPADPRWERSSSEILGAWFVITWKRPGESLKVFYNQSAQECFQVVSRRSWVARFLGGLKIPRSEQHAE